MASVFRAIFGYLFLVFITRIAGRRPGKQLTPFEFILIFFLGGLTLTGMVQDEVSVANAFSQIIAIAACHYALAWGRMKSSWLARALDGTPLVLLEKKQWRINTMQRMRVGDDDVMAMARDQGLKTLSDVEAAVLERNGEISIIPAEDKE